MADYPILAPNLPALQATKDDPQGTEDAGKIDDVLRQTRNWMYDFLSFYFDSGTGKLKAAAFADGTFPPGSIRGSQTPSLGGAQREILQGSIQTADIADAAVNNTKLADGAVGRDELANSAVTAEKIADGAVTVEKLGAGSIGSTQLKDNSVTSAKIVPGTISVGKYQAESIKSADIGKNQVTGDRLPIALQGQLLVGGQGANQNELGIQTISGAITIGANGVATLNPAFAAETLAYCRIAEKTSSGVDAGTSVVTAWNQRGASPSPPWSIETQTRAFVNVLGEKIEILEDGVFLISVSAPAVRSNTHKIRMTVKPDVESSTINTYYGTSEYSSAAAQYASTRSWIQIVLGFANNTDTLHPYFSIEHWTQAGLATVGLGVSTAAAGGSSEYYADVSILRIA